MLRLNVRATGTKIFRLARFWRITSSALLCLSIQALAQSGPVSLNISGGLFDATGKVISNSSVSFKLEILDKSSLCVLYSEYHNGVDLSSSKGAFSLILGSGTSVNNYISGTTSLDAKVFLNSGAVPPFAGCPSGVTLSPGDSRMVRVSYDVGLGFVAMTPNVPMVSSAYATVADTLQGKAPTDFIQVHNDATNLLTQTNVEFAFNSTNWPKLQNLLSGSSTQYIPSTPTSAVDFNNQRLVSVGAPTTSTDATNKNYVDNNLGGLKLNLSSMGTTSNGMALVWDQTNSQWVPGSVATSDNTKLPLAGGTMAGNINMNGNNVLNLGVLGLGNYTSGTEATLTGSLTGANKGTTWYNSTQNMLTVWDGTTAIRQAYLDAGGKLSPSWIPNTTVTAATYGTSNQIPVFTVGADGRITSATTIALSGVAPSGTASGDLTGNYPGPTIAPNAVTTAKINNDSITSAKINSTGIAVNQLVATDAVTGTTLTYFTCSLNQIMSWTASGWACTTVSSLAPVTSVAGKTGAVTLNAADISGLGNAATQNYGTAANDLVQLNASAQLPALDGSLLTNINATKLQSRTVASTAPSAGQVLGYNGSTSQWEPTSAAAGSITSITAGTGLLGGPITSSGTLSVNVGNGANQIVQENASSQILQTAGNAGAPTYSFSGSTNTGLFSPFANSVALSASGTAALTVTSGGNVGVGTTAPAGLLHAYVAIGDPLVQIETGNNGYSELRLKNPANNWGLILNGSTNQVLFKNNATAAWPLIINGDATTNSLVLKAGNVGIGTTGPQAGLDIATTGTASSAIIVPRDSTANRPTGINGMIRYNTSSSSLEGFINGSWQSLASGGGGASQWTTVGSNVYYNGGSVGIGTTAPGYPLDVFGTIEVFGAQPNLQFKETDAAVDNQRWWWVPQNGVMRLQALTDAGAGGGSVLDIGRSAQSLTYLSFGSTGNPALYADASAVRVGIGTATPVSPLEVSATTGALITMTKYQNTAGDAWINGRKARGTSASPLAVQAGDYLSEFVGTGYDGSSWISTGAVQFLVDGTSSGGNIPTALLFETGTTTTNERMRISSSGNVGIGTTAPQAALDVATSGPAASAIILPRDTTSNRPSTAVNGMIRYNTNTASIEGFANGAWSIITGAAGGGSVWSLNGTNAYYNGGNVGIGTTSPNFALQVSGTGANETIEIDNSTSSSFSRFWAINDVGNNAFVRMNGSATANTNLNNMPNSGVFEAASASGDMVLDSNNNMLFATGGVAFANERMRITSSGNVGIGTTSPGTTLDVLGTGALFRNSNGAGVLISVNAGIPAPFVNFNDTTGAAKANIYYDQAIGSMRVNSLGTNTLLNSAGGNVGIGTTSPASKLDVNGSVRVGADATACSATIQGAIHLNGTSLEYCNGTAWTPFTTGTNGSYLSSSGGTVSGAVTISSGGASITGGINNNSGGITNAGSITGVGSNITGSGALTVAAGGSAQNLTLSSSTSGSVNIGSGNGTSLSVLDGGTSTVNHVTVKGAATGGSPVIGTDGSDANINLTISPKGTGNTVITNGNVGIGTTSPQATLTVYNPNMVGAGPATSGTAPSSGLVTRISNPGGAVLDLGMYNSGTQWLQATNWANQAFTYPIVLNPVGGNVGIGTTNPTSTLYVNGTEWVVGASAALSYGVNAVGSAPANGMFAPLGNTLAFSSTATERMRIDSSGNVGVGTMGPTSKLNVNGSVEVDGGDIYRNLYYNAGWYYSATGAPAFAIRTASGNITQFVVAPTGTAGAVANPVTSIAMDGSNGNVGVGTVAPNATLDVNGNAQLENSAGYTSHPAVSTSLIAGELNANQVAASDWGILRLSAGGRTSAGAKSYIDISGYSTGSDMNQTIVLGTGSTERMRVTATGNVGIGTSAPISTLQVAGTITAPVIQSPSSSMDLALRTQSTTAGPGSVYFQDSQGNPVMEAAPVGNRTNYSWTRIDAGTDTLPPHFGSFSNAANPGLSLGAYTNQTLNITAAGNVGIGTTNPAAPLHVVGPGDGTAALKLTDASNTSIEIRSSAGGSPYIDFAINSTSDTGGGTPDYGGRLIYNPVSNVNGFSFYTNSSTTPQMVITSAGNVGIGTAGPNYKLDVAGDINTSSCFRIGATTVSGTCTSDERLKENIQDYNQGLNELLGIRLRTYQFNGLGEMPKTGETAVGVIAQEVEKTNPDLVKTRLVKMHPEDEEKTEIKVVDYSKFTYMLINAVKELYSKITHLRDTQAAQAYDLASLKAENDELKAKDAARTKEISELKARDEVRAKEISDLKTYLCAKDPNAAICK